MENSLIIALIVLFLHSCTWQGMVFSGIKKLLDEDKWWTKPIYTCPICMTPWWGSFIYWLFIGISVSDWMITVLASGGISVLFVVALAIREACIKYIDS